MVVVEEMSMPGPDTCTAGGEPTANIEGLVDVPKFALKLPATCGSPKDAENIEDAKRELNPAARWGSMLDGAVGPRSSRFREPTGPNLRYEEERGVVTDSSVLMKGVLPGKPCSVNGHAEPGPLPAAGKVPPKSTLGRSGSL